MKLEEIVELEEDELELGKTEELELVLELEELEVTEEEEEDDEDFGGTSFVTRVRRWIFPAKSPRRYIVGVTIAQALNTVGLRRFLETTSAGLSLTHGV